MIFGVKPLNFALAIVLMFAFDGWLVLGMPWVMRLRSNRPFLQFVAIMNAGGVPMFFAFIQTLLCHSPDTDLMSVIFPAELIVGIIIVLILAARESIKRRKMR